ncbi:hypothetical protein BH20ACT6_BH20ACT6_25540 [soil metagenome]
MSTTDDPVDEVERALIQIPYLLAQGIETAARVRVMRAERSEHAERAGAEADVRAAADTARQLHDERDQASPMWQRADDRSWVRSAEPGDLFETWATATAWQEHDRGAAASAQRAEAEMRRRWPDQMRLYDDARTAGLAAPEAMRNMVNTATNAGWDPTRAAHPRSASGSRLALVASTVHAADPANLAGREARQGDGRQPLNPVERATRYLPDPPMVPVHTSQSQPKGHGPGRPAQQQPRWPLRR